MSREGELIRRAMKKSLLPALAVTGFSGTSSTFQRLIPEFQDLLAIQYHKYGVSFILDFGRRERGSLHTAWGAIVPEEKLSDLPARHVRDANVFDLIVFVFTLYEVNRHPRSAVELEV
jgi:hypothetical protein